MTEITDLIARLEELEKAAAPLGHSWEWTGIADHGSYYCPFCHITGRASKPLCPVVAAREELRLLLRNNLPAIIHALKVQEAAEAACQEMTWAEFIGKKWPALVRAVKGEQP